VISVLLLLPTESSCSESKAAAAFALVVEAARYQELTDQTQRPNRMTAPGRKRTLEQVVLPLIAAAIGQKRTSKTEPEPEPRKSMWRADAVNYQLAPI